MLINHLTLQRLCADKSFNPSKAQEERSQAVQASESAYEVSKLLREQLLLVSRERDLARKQVWRIWGGGIPPLSL